MFKSRFAPSPRFHLQLDHRIVDISASQTLLQSALLHGVQIPHGCKAGGCGMCKCRLISGKVEQIMQNSAKLTESELSRGFIFACCCIPKSDLQIEVIPQVSDTVRQTRQQQHS